MVNVKQIAADIKDMATGVDHHKDGKSKKRAAYSGAVVGMIGGAVLGYTVGWNVVISIIGGGLVGGLITGIAAPKD